MAMTDVTARAYSAERLPMPGGIAERRELAALGRGQALGAVRGQTPRFRLQRHGDVELDRAAGARPSHGDAAQRTPRWRPAVRAPVGHALSAVHDPLGEDGRADLSKTHAIRIALFRCPV